MGHANPPPQIHPEAMLKWTTTLIKMKVSRIEGAESLKPLYFCTEVSVC